jgi:hypothetical protein
MWVVRPYKLVSRLKKACVNGFCYLKQKKKNKNKKSNTCYLRRFKIIVITGFHKAITLQDMVKNKSNTRWKT